MDPTPSRGRAALERLLLEGQADVRPWPKIGLLLENIHRTREWEGSARNFTAWMNLMAPKVGLKSASLWRFMRAARVYRQLREDLASRNLHIPPIEELSPRVGAENLELIDKIRRVAPVQLTDSLVMAFVRCESNRQGLRVIWEAYRPALGGKTAQGRGYVTPRVDPRDPAAVKALVAGDLVTALRAQKGAWTGLAEPDVYKVFSSVEIAAEVLPVQALRPEVDAVVVSRKSAEDEVVFQAFKIAGKVPSPDDWKDFWAIEPCVDGLWLVVTRSPAPALLQEFPVRFGVLWLRQGALRVLRAASPLHLHCGEEGSVDARGSLAKQLLLRVLTKIPRNRQGPTDTPGPGR